MEQWVNNGFIGGKNGQNSTIWYYYTKMVASGSDGIQEVSGSIPLISPGSSEFILNQDDYIVQYVTKDFFGEWELRQYKKGGFCTEAAQHNHHIIVTGKRPFAVVPTFSPNS